MRPRLSKPEHGWRGVADAVSSPSNALAAMGRGPDAAQRPDLLAVDDPWIQRWAWGSVVKQVNRVLVIVRIRVGVEPLKLLITEPPTVVKLRIIVEINALGSERVSVLVYRPFDTS